MRIAISAGALLVAAAFALVPAHVSAASLTPEVISGDFGNEIGTPNIVTGKDQGKQATNALVTIYNCTSPSSPPNFGFSSTDLAAIWGDEIFTTGTGLLSSNAFTIYNGSAAGLNLLTATVKVQFFDAVTSASLGFYSTAVNFGAGMGPGFFSTVTTTALDPLLININTTDVIVTQTLLAKTGTANKLGIASSNPPTVGSSPNTMFISASTVGPAGFYNIGAPPNFTPANPGYMLAVQGSIVGARSKSWSQLKKLYQ